MTAATKEGRSTPWHVWVVGAVAVLWNALGCYDYTMTKVVGDAYMSGAGMTEAQIAYIHSAPAWTTGTWALGVWGGALGGVLVLLRRKLAVPVFAVSLAAFLATVFYTFVIAKGGEVMGQNALVFDGVIFAGCVFFLWYARQMTKQGLLR